MNISSFPHLIDKYSKKLSTRFIINSVRSYGYFIPENRIRASWYTENFGDKLTPYLIEKISGVTPIKVNYHCIKSYYAMCGSILQWLNHNAIIWGSGIISRYVNIVKPRKIYAVRGPISRKRLKELGYDCPEIYGDPALLLPSIYETKQKNVYKLGIIPHYVDFEEVKFKKYVKDYEKNDILVINVNNPIEKIINEINMCENLISSSLHGLIVSHAYNKNCLWVKFSDKIYGDDTKFFDYLYSVDIKPYEPYMFKNNEIVIGEIKEICYRDDKKTKPKQYTIKKIQENLLSSYPLPINH